MTADHNSPHRTVFLKDYRPFPFKTESIRLCFDLFEDQTVVTATTRFVRRAGAFPLELNGEKLELLDIKLDGDSLAVRPLSI